MMLFNNVKINLNLRNKNMNNIVELNQQEVAAISGGGVIDYAVDAYKCLQWCN